MGCVSSRKAKVTGLASESIEYPDIKVFRRLENIKINKLILLRRLCFTNSLDTIAEAMPHLEVSNRSFVVNSD